MSKTTWKKELEATLWAVGETLADIESNTMSEKDMNTRFDSGFGGSEGCAFTVWTKNRVYFPVVYDGAEWIGSVPRNPNGEATDHQGG